MPRTVLNVSDAARQMMEALGLNGSFDVRWQGGRSKGWVGKPGGEDVTLVIVIEPLPPVDAPAQ